MGRQSWRFEGQAFESPQISVFDPRQGIPFALLQIVLQRPDRPADCSILVMTGQKREVRLHPK
jgi:hypothetical protein